MNPKFCPYNNSQHHTNYLSTTGWRPGPCQGVRVVLAACASVTKYFLLLEACSPQEIQINSSNNERPNRKTLISSQSNYIWRQKEWESDCNFAKWGNFECCHLIYTHRTTRTTYSELLAFRQLRLAPDETVLFHSISKWDWYETSLSW